MSSVTPKKKEYEKITAETKEQEKIKIFFQAFYFIFSSKKITEIQFLLKLFGKNYIEVQQIIARNSSIPVKNEYSNLSAIFRLIGKTPFKKSDNPLEDYNHIIELIKFKLKNINPRNLKTPDEENVICNLNKVIKFFESFSVEKILQLNTIAIDKFFQDTIARAPTPNFSCDDILKAIQPLEQKRFEAVVSYASEKLASLSPMLKPNKNYHLTIYPEVAEELKTLVYLLSDDGLKAAQSFLSDKPFYHKFLLSHFIEKRKLLKKHIIKNERLAVNAKKQEELLKKTVSNCSRDTILPDLKKTHTVATFFKKKSEKNKRHELILEVIDLLNHQPGIEKIKEIQGKLIKTKLLAPKADANPNSKSKRNLLNIYTINSVSREEYLMYIILDEIINYAAYPSATTQNNIKRFYGQLKGIYDDLPELYYFDQRRGQKKMFTRFL